MGDTGGNITDFTTFWVCVVIIVIGWPVAIVLKRINRRRRIAARARERRVRQSDRAWGQIRAEDDCFFRVHGQPTPDDLREGM